MTKKRKFGIWLHNHTDRRDDEWIFVWAKTAAEAKTLANYDVSRFSLGYTAPVEKFRKLYGLKGL